MQRNTHLLWDGLILGTGALLIGLTLHSYYPPSPTFHAMPTLSKAEADRQIDSAKAYLASHPEDFDALETLAMGYYQKGPDYYVDAMNALEKARSLGATDVRLFFYAGVMYDALGLPEYAVNELSKYLRHHPSDYETMVRLANVYFHQKNYDLALNLYKQALREWPKDPTVWFNYAIVNKEKSNFPTALSALDQVQRIAGRLPEGGLYEEGEIYRLQGNGERASAFYQEELAKRPDFLPAVQAMEVLARKRGDYKLAQALRKRIAEIKNQAKNLPLPPAPVPVATPPVTPLTPPPAAPIKIERVRVPRSVESASTNDNATVQPPTVEASTPTAVSPPQVAGPSLTHELNTSTPTAH